MRPFLHSFRRMAQSKYPDLHDTLEQHFARLGDDSDIEELLSGLGKAERLSDAMPGGTIDSAELRVWQEQSRYLKSHLISYIIEQCERYDEESVKAVLSPSLRMLTDLAEIETVHIFTTNYDRIVEVACEEADIEYADGFGETGNELVAPWTRTFDKKVCIYKLHGSVSYYVDQARRDTSKFLRLDRGYPLPGPDFRLSREGNELEPLMVLPTLEKDALGEPYSHLNHLFTEVMSETVLVVAVGISLRDNRDRSKCVGSSLHRRASASRGIERSGLDRQARRGRASARGLWQRRRGRITEHGEPVVDRLATETFVGARTLVPSPAPGAQIEPGTEQLQKALGGALVHVQIRA